MGRIFGHGSRVGILSFAGIASLAVAASFGTPAAAGRPSTGSGARAFAQTLDDTGGHDADVEGTDELNSFAFERTAPALSVSGDALAAAEAQAELLPEIGGSWNQLTNNPENAGPAGFDDPIWSNAGAGFANVSGRVTALAADGAD